MRLSDVPTWQINQQHEPHELSITSERALKAPPRDELRELWYDASSESSATIRALKALTRAPRAPESPYEPDGAQRPLNELKMLQDAHLG